MPAELVEIIVSQTVELLVQEELKQPTEALVNRFLTSASLVSSEWRPIAQEALLRSGTVIPSAVGGYWDATQWHGVPQLLRVKLPASRLQITWTPAMSAEMDDMLQALVPHLSGLKEIQCMAGLPRLSPLSVAFPGQRLHVNPSAVPDYVLNRC